MTKAILLGNYWTANKVLAEGPWTSYYGAGFAGDASTGGESYKKQVMYVLWFGEQDSLLEFIKLI